MSNPYPESNNPYSSPIHSSQEPPSRSGSAKPKIMAPAIALLIISMIGLLASLFNVVFALVGEPFAPDPAAPDWVNEMQKNSVGGFAAGLQAFFALLNLVIMFGAIQMLRLKSWGASLVASILAMINFGTCCCVLGIPVGIWSLVILLQNDVRKAFEEAAENA